MIIFIDRSPLSKQRWLQHRHWRVRVLIFKAKTSYQNFIVAKFLCMLETYMKKCLYHYVKGNGLGRCLLKQIMKQVMGSWKYFSEMTVGIVGVVVSCTFPWFPAWQFTLFCCLLNCNCTNGIQNGKPLLCWLCFSWAHKINWYRWFWF